MSYLATNIIPNVWIGNFQSAEKEVFFDKNFITSVLNLSKTIPNHFIYDSKVEYIRIPIDKHTAPQFPKYFPLIAEYIYKTCVLDNKILLIHGIDKDIACIALSVYLLKYYNMNIDEIQDFFKSKSNEYFNCNIQRQLLEKWSQLIHN
jgi:hypothetical protein